MKKIFCILGILIAGTQAPAQQLETRPGPDGIWVIPGTPVNTHSKYKISRSTSGSAWQPLGDMTPATSLEDFKARYYRLGGSGASLSGDRMAATWQRFSRYGTDSVGGFKDDLRVMGALGAAWFDGDAISGTLYTYKLESAGNDAAAALTPRPQKYPAEKTASPFAPLSAKAILNGVYAEFEVKNKNGVQSCRVYRSYYMRSGYEPINPRVIFIQRDNKLVATFTDYTVSPKVPYSYKLAAVDAAGNESSPSEPVHLFAVPKNSIPPTVTNFHTASAEKQNAIRLSWELKQVADIISVDIYKSPSVDGKYVKIASISPKDTVYYDHDVTPIVTYFYKIFLNGIYEQSASSPHVPGIMKANRRNLFAPAHLTVKADNNTAVLNWHRSKTDARGYYVYRAEGYKGPLKRISSIILSADSVITYRDSLPRGANATVYSYAVTDENTSYAESPKSERASLAYTPEMSLPIASHINVAPVSDKKVRIIWTNMGDARISGYRLYKRIVDANGKETAAAPVNKNIIPPIINYYTDSDLAEGNQYYYSVQAVSGDKQGSPSLEAGYSVPVSRVMQVSNIQAFPRSNEVLLKWNVPVGEPLQKIRILKCLPGGTPQTIATLDAPSDSYSDKDVKQGNTYYYYFVTENNRKSSKPTTPVSVVVN